MTADLVLVGGTVFTADRAGSTAEAVALAGSRFLATGGSAELMSRFPDAAVLDVGGRTVLPGLIDAHNHYLATGEGLGSIDARYPAISSVDDLVAAVARAAAETAPGTWIRGFGFDHGKFDRAPTRWDLDTATTRHPVAIRHVSGHYLLVNSRVLDAAGVDDSTPDPKGGAFVRDDQGRNTGLCMDAACGLVEPVAVDIGSHGPNFHVDITIDELVEAVARAGEAYLSVGLTTVCDAQVTRREMSGYLESRRRGKWWVRVACMPLSHQLDAFDEIGVSSRFGDDRLWIGAMKFYMDGSLIGGTAVFSEPYGENGEFPGVYFWEPEEMKEMLISAHCRGWQVGIHTQGDRAIEAVLDAIEAAHEACPRLDARPRIEHCGYPLPAQVERMARLGVIAVVQPNYLRDQGDEFLARLGDRAERLLPLRELLDAGVRVALSSDADVTSFNPLESIANAVARRTLEGRSIGSGQALTVAEAVRAHTIDAAYAIKADDRLGSIEPGKLADLTVVDGDLFGAVPEEIRTMDIWMTMLDGEVVYGGPE